MWGHSRRESGLLSSEGRDAVLGIRVVQCDFQLTPLKHPDLPQSVLETLLHENVDLPPRQPVPGKPTETRPTEVCSKLMHCTC